MIIPRIVFCNHFAQPGWLDGAEISLLQLMRVLPEDIYQKFLISPSAGEMPDLAMQSGIEVKIIPTQLVWTIGGLVGLESTGCSSLRAHLEQVKRKQKQEIAELKRYLVQIRPERLLVNTSVNVIPALVGKELGLKVIWIVREFFRGQLEATGEVLNQFADEIWVTSNAMVHLLGQIPGLSKRVRKIPNFIDPAYLQEDMWSSYRQAFRIKNGVLPDEIAVGFWGSISPKKGIADFIRMAANLKDNHGRIRFFLAGCAIKDEYLYAMRDYINQFELDQVVQYTGFFPEPQYFLPAMDLIVLPSHFNETFSRSAMEAQFFYKPVIAYDGGGIHDVVQDGLSGFLVPKGDIEMLTESCARLANDRDLRLEFGGNGRFWVDKHFAAARVLPELLEALQE